MKPTIYSIASSVGVSASTVSRALNRPDLVRPERRKEILRVADEQGYELNRAARALVTGSSSLIGVAVIDITNPYVPPLVREIERHLQALERSALLLDMELSKPSAASALRALGAQVDALVVIAPRLPEDELRSAVQGVPAVFVNHRVPGLAAVLCDDGPALAQAGQELVRLGHEDLALLTGPNGSWSAGVRARAIRAWADSEPNVTLTEVGPMEVSFEAGWLAAAGLLETPVTAVIAFDDLLACGVIAGLAEAGKQVPGDYSVLGCDDVLLARTLTPRLSTIAAPFEELGRHVADALLASMAGAEAIEYVSQGTFVPRGTTAPAPQVKLSRKRAFRRTVAARGPCVGK